MQDIDLLAIVTRPDFPSGNGPIGDHLGLARFAAKRPGLVVRTIVLNAGGTSVHIEAGHALITQGDEPPIDLNRIRLVLYMPVSLEVEETNSQPSARKSRTLSLPRSNGGRSPNISSTSCRAWRAA